MTARVVSRRLRSAAALAVAGSLAVGGALMGVALAGPAQAAPITADQQCDAIDANAAEVFAARSTTSLAESLDYDSLHRLSTGSGVTVAVIDSGVEDGLRGLPRQEVLVGRTSAGVEDDHGTNVAGLIAGRAPAGTDVPLGVAPGARIFSVKVLDAEEATDPLIGLSNANLVAGLNRVAAEAEDRRIKVVNLSLTEDDSDELAEAVRRVQRAGVLVVASVPNPPQQQEGAPPPPRRAVGYPAAYPGVLAVSAPVVLGAAPAPGSASDATQLTALTSGAVTYGHRGSTCLLDTPGTSYSAAVVSGAAALLFEKNPSWSPERVRTQLIETASGVSDVANPYGGGGVVQPLEALTRVVEVDDAGRVVRPERLVPEPEGATVPTAQDDPLRDSRSDFLWWGLIAGATGLLALVLSPVARRLRRSSS